MIVVRLCRAFGWTWDETENSVTIERLLAIQKSFEVFPPDYEMVTFVAYANGYKKAKEDADARAQAIATTRKRAHSGAAVIELFPEGVINLDGLVRLGG